MFSKKETLFFVPNILCSSFKHRMFYFVRFCRSRNNRIIEFAQALLQVLRYFRLQLDRLLSMLRRIYEYFSAFTNYFCCVCTRNSEKFRAMLLCNSLFHHFSYFISKLFLFHDTGISKQRLVNIPL